MIKQIAFLLLTILILSAGTLAAPTASLEASPENGPSPLTVNFSGDCSDSNAIVSCTIDLGDGNMVVDLNSLGGSHTYYARGTYYLNLFALNSKGESDDEITVITVSNQAPTAALNVSPGSGNPGLVVTLSGSCQDLDGNATIKTCFLDYGDGNAEAIAGPAPYCFSKTHTFYQIGQLQAKLRASDDMDLNGQDIEVVTISATAAPTITNKSPITATTTGSQRNL